MQGLELSQQDLADEFVLALESVVFDLRRERDDMGFLSQEDLTHLALAEKRLANIHQKENLYFGMYVCIVVIVSVRVHRFAITFVYHMSPRLMSPHRRVF